MIPALFPSRAGRYIHGGGSGIRTHGSLRIPGFQDRCFKPLSHPSSFGFQTRFNSYSMTLSQVIRDRCCRNLEISEPTAHGAPKIAHTSVPGQPRLPLLPRSAQGQRKAKAPFFSITAILIGISPGATRRDRTVTKKLSSGCRQVGKLSSHLVCS
jgi:hypothetical protein